MFQQSLESMRRIGGVPARYGNFIGGRFIDPVEGLYFSENLVPSK